MTPGPFDAWWLPVGTGDAPLESMRSGELEVRYPDPGGQWLKEQLTALGSAGQRLKERPVLEIVDVIDHAAARLGESDDPLRRQAESLVSACTGYHPAMTRLVLDRMSADWRREPLLRLLRHELGDPAAVDGFVPRRPGTDPPSSGDRVRAYGPDLAFHVFAGNVPGVAVTSLVRSLLVKAPVLGKLASGQPVLPVLFARALHEVDPELAAAVGLSYWPGGERQAEQAALAAADTVVIYGGEGAVAALRERVPPTARLIVHGPRFSAGLIGADAPAPVEELAQEAAQAVAAFDQHGCVSPHALWVEDVGDGRAAAFARALATAMERLAEELPRGAVSAAEASAIQQARGAAELRGIRSGGKVLASGGTRWTVVYDPEPGFRPSCLNRFVYVHPVAELDSVMRQLEPHGHLLQSVALEVNADRRDRLADRLARLGATRVSTLRRLPWPPPEWHHDGRGALTELVRWVDLED